MCFEFTTEEIVKYLIEPLNCLNEISIKIKSYDDELLTIDTSGSSSFFIVVEDHR